MISDIVEGAIDKSETGLLKILSSQTNLRAIFAAPVVVVEAYLLLFSSASISGPVIALTTSYYIYILLLKFLIHYRSILSARQLLTLTAVMDPILFSSWQALTGEYGSVMVGLFLFTILGFGFRTGRPLMHMCQLTTIGCFFFVGMHVPYWQQHPIIWFAMLVPLVAIPLYAGVLLKTLRESRELAQRESSAKSELLAKVSHELRTPLAGIISATELLALESGQASVLRRTDTILNLSNELLTEINELLDEAKFGARTARLENAPIDLARHLALVREALESTATGKGIVLKVALDPLISGQVESDSHHLGRVLLNLTSNAVKFTDRGVVGVAIDLLEDSVSSYRLRFSVTDTGIGIPESFREEIFEPFSQVDQGSNRRYAGTGLGLAISRRIVELMGGTLRFESEVGKGSRFWFDVSMMRSTDSIATVAIAEADTVSAVIVVAKRILVAEDNETNLLLLRELLEIDGHEVITCSSGLSALEVLADQEVDLLLLDYNLGDMDGIRLLQTYRYGTRMPAPALFLTADMTQRTAARFREVASDAGILYKPITLSKLRQAIRNLEWSAAEVEPAALDGDAPIASNSQARPTLSAVAVSPLDRQVIDELKSVSSRAEFFPNLLCEAQNDIQRTCGQILEALALQNYSSMRDAAHALKGVSANVGAVRLFALANKLMVASREDFEGAFDRWSTDLNDELRTTIAALKKEIGDACASSLPNGTTSLHSG